ncbi:UDP-glucuronosyl/UDP-glucosyltransferase [Corchorus capsularis]|uniref:UDP-glucuronosyl/UDP-glucosyltransferase n=1 Tax=Corchorus capsularis TaxID=210143 RepID=A0A1R3I9B4_COCAP|nr:UDP-glucuronosyl/UDP-glucosyltransferase [Corchorus capsularis]
MASKSNIAQKPHAICVPSPGQGHINPMMNLAKIFHHKGFHVTFVNTECNHKRLLSSMGPSSLDGLPDFRFETIPDGVPLDTTQDITSLLDTLTENVVDPLRRLIQKLNDFESSNVPPVTCIVADAAVPFLEVITEEFGILGVRLGTAGASTFERYIRVRLSVEQGLIPVTDVSSKMDEYLDRMPSAVSVDVSAETNEYLDKNTQVPGLVEEGMKLATDVSDITNEYLDRSTQASSFVENGNKLVTDVCRITNEYLDRSTQISGLIENLLNPITDTSDITDEYLDRSAQVSGIVENGLKPVTDIHGITDEYLDRGIQVFGSSDITDEYLDRSAQVSGIVENGLKPVTDVSGIIDEYLDRGSKAFESSDIKDEYLDKSAQVSDVNGITDEYLDRSSQVFGSSDIIDEYLDRSTQVSGIVENGLKPVTYVNGITDEYLDRGSQVFESVEEVLKPITNTSYIADEYLDRSTRVSDLVKNGLKPVTAYVSSKTDEYLNVSSMTAEYLDKSTQVSDLVENGLKPVTDVSIKTDEYLDVSSKTDEYLDKSIQVSNLVENDLSYGYLDSTRNCLPIMKNIRFKDLNSNDSRLMHLLNEAPHPLTCTVINTFDSLENDTLNAIVSAMPGIPVYSIGPLHLIADQIIQDNKLNQIGSNLWKEEPDCVQWLDSKEPNSVVYVNFGSVVVMAPENLIEFAWGIANSKKQFLWIVRPDLVKSEVASFLPEFISEIKDRGMITSWCAQEQVLKHPSIGGFISHMGWNSTIESLSAGVPMLCLPFFADQLTSCKVACTKWGTGMEISSDVKRDQVEMLVRELMDGEKGIEMKANALEWKKKAEEASKPTGSSFHNLDKLFSHLLSSGKHMNYLEKTKGKTLKVSSLYEAQVVVGSM